MIPKNSKCYGGIINKWGAQMYFKGMVELLDVELKNSSYKSRFYEFLDKAITKIVTDEKGELEGIYFIIEDFELYMSLNEEDIIVYSINCEYENKMNFIHDYNESIMNRVLTYAYYRVYPEKWEACKNCAVGT